jgi:hypothetical protein
VSARQATPSVRPFLAPQYGGASADDVPPLDLSRPDDVTAESSRGRDSPHSGPPRLTDDGAAELRALGNTCEKMSLRSGVGTPSTFQSRAPDTISDESERSATPLKKSVTTAPSEAVLARGPELESRVETPQRSSPAREVSREAASHGDLTGRPLAEGIAPRTSPMNANPTYATRRDSEPAPEITVSIGHIEIRSVPAPAPARRAEFRPSVTLSEFLKRRSAGRS